MYTTSYIYRCIDTNIYLELAAVVLKKALVWEGELLPDVRWPAQVLKPAHIYTTISLNVRIFRGYWPD